MDKIQEHILDFEVYQKELGMLNKREDEINNLIESKIYAVLFGILNSDFNDIDELKRAFILQQNIENDEFWFIYPFGNISFEKLLIIDSYFKKSGFQISRIIALDDTYKDKNGLEITFIKVEP